LRLIIASPLPLVCTGSMSLGRYECHTSQEVFGELIAGAWEGGHEGRPPLARASLLDGHRFWTSRTTKPMPRISTASTMAYRLAVLTTWTRPAPGPASWLWRGAAAAL